MLAEGKPRTLMASDNQCWFLQTDASSEPGDSCATAGMGAVLFDPAGVRSCEVFVSNEAGQIHSGKAGPRWNKEPVDLRVRVPCAIYSFLDMEQSDMWLFGDIYR